MTRLLIAAPSPLARAGLASLAAPHDVVASVPLSDLEPAIDRFQPDVVLAALESHYDEPPEDLLALAGRASPPAMVVLSPDLQTSWSAEALRAGIRAVLPGDLGSREILAAIEAAAAGLAVIHPLDIPALTPERSLPASPAESLTPRELQVLSMLAEGHGNKTIAWKLGISEHTAKFHVASILTKLNAGTRTEAVTRGIRHGLIMV